MSSSWAEQRDHRPKDDDSKSCLSVALQCKGLTVPLIVSHQYHCHPKLREDKGDIECTSQAFLFQHHDPSSWKEKSKCNIRLGKAKGFVSIPVLWGGSWFGVKPGQERGAHQSGQVLEQSTDLMKE